MSTSFGSTRPSLVGPSTSASSSSLSPQTEAFSSSPERSPLRSTAPAIDIADVDAASFNNKVQITFGWLSPMLVFDTRGATLRYDDAAELRWGPDVSNGSSYGSSWLSFVGTGYALNGRAANKVTRPLSKVGENYLYHSTGSSYLRNLVIGAPFEYYNGTLGSLGSMRGLDMSSYRVEANFTEGTSITFLNATVTIPVVTQA